MKTGLLKGAIAAGGVVAGYPVQRTGLVLPVSEASLTLLQDFVVG